MLSENERIKYETFEICKNSGDVEIGETFHGVMNDTELNNRPCVCIGKLGDERLFGTEDRTCYFTVSDGWGKKDGRLVGMHIGNFLRFDKPSGIEEIRAYIKNREHPNSPNGATLRFGEKAMARMYIEALATLDKPLAARDTSASVHASVNNEYFHEKEIIDSVGQSVIERLNDKYHADGIVFTLLGITTPTDNSIWLRYSDTLGFIDTARTFLDHSSMNDDAYLQCVADKLFFNIDVWYDESYADEHS